MAGVSLGICGGGQPGGCARGPREHIPIRDVPHFSGGDQATSGFYAATLDGRTLHRHPDAASDRPLSAGGIGPPYTTQPDASGRRDFNLGSRRNALYEAIGFEELFSACNRVRQRGRCPSPRIPAVQFAGQRQGAERLAELDVSRRGLERRGRAILEEGGGTAVRFGGRHPGQYRCRRWYRISHHQARFDRPDHRL